MARDPCAAYFFRAGQNAAQVPGRPGGARDVTPRQALSHKRAHGDLYSEQIATLHRGRTVKPAETKPVRSEPPDRRRVSSDLGSLLGLINGVIAAIGGVYLSTRSVPITVLAGVAALVPTVLIIWRN
jgi:hypothetical protein